MPKKGRPLTRPPRRPRDRGARRVAESGRRGEVDPVVRAGRAAAPYTEQQYMEDMMALRREYELRLEDLDGQRQERLNQIPAVAEPLARLHQKIQTADATRARVLEDAERTLREAGSKTETQRSADFAKADDAYRDRKTELDRQLEDDSRKAKEKLEAAIREIEAKFPSLADQTRPKEKAYEQYRRDLKSAQDTHNREGDRSREDYQVARRDALGKERLANEAASSKAEFARSEADRAYEQTVVAAKAIFRMEVADAAPGVQAEFDERRQGLLKEWEARKEALSERYRGERRP
jgi:peptidoglycan hydrolase CwlO-like protein